MKYKIVLCLISITASLSVNAQKLIIRADDIGMSHASNIGVIKSFTDGIATSAELMVVTPWLPEAVKLLEEQSNIDVGLHAAFTSEWENLKWRPLTHCPSLTDENGYFLPFIFPNSDYPGQSLIERIDDIVLEEFESEFRAQIELAIKLVPRINHISGHMMWNMISTEIAISAERIANEYGLIFVDGNSELMQSLKIERFPMQYGLMPGEREAKFIEALDKLERDKTYLFIEHPAVGSAEMEGVFHIGYENVSTDQQEVLDLYTNNKIQNLIKEKGIELVSYKQVFEELID